MTGALSQAFGMLGINPIRLKGDMVLGCELCGAEIARHCKAMGAPSYKFSDFSLMIVLFDIHAPITLV